MDSNAPLNPAVTAGCHCPDCGGHFDSAGALDRHRTGQGRYRRCRFAYELPDYGLAQNAAGYWCSAASDRKWRAVS